MPNAAAWKDRAIYQVLTDRFAVTGHDNNGPDCDHRGGRYCGGTWQGIISKLDYIQGMGFDAVWISPITKNIEDFTEYGEAFHGYWQEDLYSVNPHFGTSDDLLALSNALHQRGMFLMVDIVVNHMGSTPTVDYSRYTPFNDSSYYHSKDFITHYEDQILIENGWLGDSKVPLPDLDTENPTVVHTLHAWISTIVQKFRIDGLRIDTVKHVHREFWPGFVRAAGVWSMGEVLSGDPDYLSAYQPYIGGLVDYGTYYPLKRAFKKDGGSMYEIMNLLTPQYRAKFADVQQMATFMENHDMPRFPNDTNSDPTVVMNALSFNFLTDGIPILYYGQEHLYSGDGDPGSRELMWTSGFKITPIYQFIAHLNRARKLAWNAGFGTNLTVPLYNDVNIAAMQKGPLLMVLSNEGSNSKPHTVSIPTRFPNGTVLVDIITSQSIIVRNSTTITIVAGQPQIYLPFALATRICSNIMPLQLKPQSSLSKLFSVFRSSSRATQNTSITFWNSGIPAVTPILPIALSTPAQHTPGTVLQPSSEKISSRYSIFSLAPRPY